MVQCPVVKGMRGQAGPSGRIMRLDCWRCGVGPRACFADHAESAFRDLPAAQFYHLAHIEWGNVARPRRQTSLPLRPASFHVKSSNARCRLMPSASSSPGDRQHNRRRAVYITDKVDGRAVKAAHPISYRWCRART